ncbi:amidohydrolase, partial [Corallococcus sp. AB004]
DRVTIKPSEYFRRQCFVAIEPSEPYLAQINQCIGSDNLIFGSDYPHMDHKPDIIEKVVELKKCLTKEIVKKIVWDNPRRFYGLV